MHAQRSQIHTHTQRETLTRIHTHKWLRFSPGVPPRGQEVETEQYYNYFLPGLKEQGYEGFFSPKSRARTMSESDRKHVDGCAIFYRTEK